jgi:hypothetical protein
MTPAFHTRTALAEAMRALFKQLEDRLELKQALDVFLAGGMAVHLYTGERKTTDVDAEFGARVHVSNTLVIEIEPKDGGLPVALYLDTNYNSTFGLMHEDYREDSLPVDMGLDWIRVHVLAPVDLAVSKIARLADNDKQDITALVRLGLTTAAEIEQRAQEALAGYVGNLSTLRLNIQETTALARQAESDARPATNQTVK